MRDVLVRRLRSVATMQPMNADDAKKYLSEAQHLLKDANAAARRGACRSAVRLAGEAKERLTAAQIITAIDYGVGRGQPTHLVPNLGRGIRSDANLIIDACVPASRPTRKRRKVRR